MGFAKKSDATQKNGKVKKGYREIQRKDGTVRYMTDDKKKPETKTKVVKKATVKKCKCTDSKTKKVKMSNNLEEFNGSDI